MSAHESMEQAEHTKEAAGENRKIALLIAVIALCLALSETLGKGAQTESISKNVEASNLWAFFQAKSIKRSLAEIESRLGSPEVQGEAKQRAERYQAEQDEIQRKAKAYESERDESAKHGPPLGTAIASLQIAIALASVCMITKRKSLWAGSSFLGAVGLIYLIYGLFLI